MPIYEYQCDGCHEVTEALQKISEAPLHACPKCGGQLHKLMSLNSFQLKGSGWYVTDYAGKNASIKTDNAASADKPAPAAGESTPAAATSTTCKTDN